MHTTTPQHRQLELRVFRLPWWGWLAAVAIVAADATIFFNGGRGWLEVGGLPQAPSLVLAPVLLVALGRQVAPAARLWWAYLCAGAYVVGMGALSAIGAGEVGGYVVAAGVEEVAFRLALPLVVLGALSLLSGGRQRPLVALSVAAAVFAVCPGHLEQMGGVLDAAPFVAMAVVLSLVIWTSGQVLFATLVHAGANLASLAWMSGAIGDAEVRALRLGEILVCAAVILVAGSQRRASTAERGPGDLTAVAPRSSQQVLAPVVDTPVPGASWRVPGWPSDGRGGVVAADGRRLRSSADLLHLVGEAPELVPQSSSPRARR